ncbi:MAG TPA: hypothetical protein VI636_25210 [Candidatus Angelobacter sp.]
MDCRRYFIHIARALGVVSNNSVLLLLALLAHLATTGTSTGRGSGSTGVGTHYMISNSIRFHLLRVSGAADRQLCLDKACAQKVLHGLVSRLLLQGKNWMDRFGNGP